MVAPTLPKQPLPLPNLTCFCSFRLMHLRLSPPRCSCIPISKLWQIAYNNPTSRHLTVPRKGI